MNELIETYKLEIEALKSKNQELIDKTTLIYNKRKNLKRANLRLKALNNKLRKTISDTISDTNISDTISDTNISDNWDCIEESLN